jgi:HSP20 family protein
LTRRRGKGDWFGGSSSSSGDISRDIDEMRREMEREFEEGFRDIQTRAPKELIREYETPEGGKVREMGPFVYGIQ